MRVLIYDLEIGPITGTAWGTYKTNLLSIDKDNELISVAYKFDEEKTKVISKRTHTEKQMTKLLWAMFNEADVIIGHNVDGFDNKVSNKYFIKHGLTPPSPYKTVDTLKIARRYFRFASNKLDYIGQYLFKDRKHTTNMQLWFDCLKGDEDALKRMEAYNIQDVDLTYKVYHKLKGWHTGHPNVNLYQGTSHKCPKCGGNTQRRGLAYTRTQQYHRFQCTGECKGWSTGERVPLAEKIIK